MLWVKSPTDLHDDPALMRAGEAAEVLYARALSWSGARETSGHIPAEVLTRLAPARAKARAAALVREGLWEQKDDGFRFVSDAICDATSPRSDEEKNAAAERQRNKRNRDRARKNTDSHGPCHSVTAPVTPSVTGAVTPPVTEGVTFARAGEELELEVDTAAAAAVKRAAAAAVSDPPDEPARPGDSGDRLPVSVGILRDRLQAHTPLAALRFDQLTATQIRDLEALVDTHGDHALVDVALRTLRSPPPVSVAAFLGSWKSLPHPGQRLALVTPGPRQCPTHDTPLTPSGACTSCAADQKAADR